MAIMDSGYIDGKNDGIKEMIKNNISFEVILKITHMSKKEVEKLMSV